VSPREGAIGKLYDWVPNLWSNPVSLVGTVVTTVAGTGLVLLFGLNVSGTILNPYTGALLFVGLPALFVFGLLLIPGGLLLYRRRRRAAPVRTLGEEVGALFSTKPGRRKLYWVAGLTLVNLVLLGAAGGRLVAWTSDPTFCGTACHEIMEPEWESYRDAEHARVACVDCHVGEGAEHLVRSKLDGMRQVWKALRGDYAKPVPAPVHSMRPSRETCETCHWSERWLGDRAVLYSHTFPDQANTERVNVLRLKLGGVDPRTGVATGYHWHAAQGTDVRYEAYDEARTKIGKVTVWKDGKVVKEFLPPGPEQPVVATRKMDCLDCHNRATHRFDASPVHALDRAFESGVLDRKVPWLREVAGAILPNAAHTRAGVEADFRREIEALYRERHADAVPDAAALDAAAKGLAVLWRDNVFPDRAVGWGTYPSHEGHQTPSAGLYGCFRCHDDKHKTADGKPLSGECEVCHETLAQDEKWDDLDEAVRTLIGGR
jgi:hypothetical protein